MIVKFAAADILEARVHQRGTARIGHKHTFEYDPRPGYLYVRSRAISSRTNDNYDNFPAPEIKKGYRSFLGKPVFVNHNNDDHRRARGVIIDAALHEDQNPDGSADTWVEVLMEISASKFPKLTQAILAGEIERTSMGVDVAFSVCSVCNHKATTPLEYCKHIPKMKGMKVRRTAASGAQEEVLVYEKCYGLAFFENSLLVEDPADPTAFFLDVDDRGLAVAGSRKRAADELGPLVWSQESNPGSTLFSYLEEGEKFRFAASPEGEVLTKGKTGWYIKGGQKFRTGPSTAVIRISGSRTAASAGGRPCSICGKPATRYVMGPYAGDWGAYYCDDHPNPPDPGSIIENLTAAAAELDAEFRQAAKNKLTFTHPRSGETFTRTTDADYTWVSFKGPRDIAWHWDEQAARRRSSEVYKLPAQKGSPSTLMGTPMGESGPGSQVPIGYGPGRQLCPQCVGEGKITQQMATGGMQTSMCSMCKGSGHVMRNDEGTIIGTGSRRQGVEGKVPPGTYYVIRENPQSLDLVDKDWRTVGTVTKADAAANGYGGSDYMGTKYLTLEKSIKRIAYGEMTAPTEVDTLREEFCPVCGEADSFDGDTCRVCQYIKPPDEFLDPDLDKAKQIDLHQDQVEVDDKQNELGELEDDIGIEEMPNEDKPQLFDEEGNPVDENGNPIEVDEDGNPIEEEELDEDGEPVEDANPFGANEEEPPDEEEDVGDDEDEDDEDEDDEEGKAKKKPPWLRKKKSRLDREVTGGDPNMGPAMRHLIGQQRRIVRLEKRNRALEAGLVALSRLAGVEGHIARVVKRAEDENPGQPEGWALTTDTPPAEPAAFTTDETLGDVNNDAPGGGNATDDVEAIGGTSETDVAPDAQTSVTDTGVVLDEPLDLDEQDPTRPVEGTDTLDQGERGNAGTNRTEIEVRTREGDTSTAFPETGWTTASRSFAALRLARLRLRAGIARGDDLALGQAIASSKLSDKEIKTETETLDRVVAANPARQQVKGQRVPRVASGQRSAPSLGSIPEPKLASSPRRMSSC